MYYNEEIEINFDLPEYIKENIENLIKARKEKRLDIDCEESELLSNINRWIYVKFLDTFFYEFLYFLLSIRCFSLIV